MRIHTTIAALALAGLFIAPQAQAQNGHMRQGVGAVNSAMGGAGAATTQSLLGTLYLNPAGLVGYDGARMEFSLDFQRPSHTVEAGSSSIEGADLRALFPSVAVASPVSDRVSLGLGAYQVGGFQTSYAGSLNGTSFVTASDYSAIRITPSVALAVTDAIWVGGSLLFDCTSFMQDPLLVGEPTDGSYPNAAGGNSQPGFGFQAGLLWNVNDFVALGASYASKTGVSSYSLPATVADPNSPSYGDLEQVSFTLESPAMLAAGLSMTPLPSLLLAADVRYMFYEDAAGFGSGDYTFDFDSALAGFGWQNVFVFNIGAEYAASDKVALRAGYNHGDSAVREELVSANLTSPAIVKDHLSFGLGWQPTRRFRIDAGYVVGFENSVNGPVLTPGGPLAENVTLKSSGNAFQLAFALGTRGF
ncbi:MAG: outer membrane protein transport protein [Gemmatimonadota bacterium]